FGELGVRVHGGRARFEPSLLRRQEFLSRSESFRYLGVDDEWHEIEVPEQGIAFTWCQVPVVYILNDDADSFLEVTSSDGKTERYSDMTLPSGACSDVFRRTGAIRAIRASFQTGDVLGS
ncbi:MAG: hypothetical protein AAF658_12255, partial [Myxococcota bacterium]